MVTNSKRLFLLHTGIADHCSICSYSRVLGRSLSLQTRSTSSSLYPSSLCHCNHVGQRTLHFPHCSRIYYPRLPLDEHVSDNYKAVLHLPWCIIPVVVLCGRHDLSHCRVDSELCCGSGTDVICEWVLDGDDWVLYTLQVYAQVLGVGSLRQLPALQVPALLS